MIDIENPKESTKKPLLELIGEFTTVTRCKVNIQKSNLFLCISKENMDTKIKNTMTHFPQKYAILWYIPKKKKKHV